MRTFMLARFGDSVLDALPWAARQRRRRETALFPGLTFLENRPTRPTGSTASMTLLENSLPTWCLFTTDAPNRIVRDSGEGNGLEAWKRLHGEYDPTSSMGRVAGSEPPLDASALRIWDLRWRPGSRRNVRMRCSLTVTNDPVRHRMTALCLPCSG